MAFPGRPLAVPGCTGRGVTVPADFEAELVNGEGPPGGAATLDGTAVLDGAACPPGGGFA